MMRKHTSQRRATLLLAALLLGPSADGVEEPEPDQTALPAPARDTGQARAGRVKLASSPDADARCASYCVARDIPVYVPPNRGSVRLRIGGASRGA